MKMKRAAAPPQLTITIASDRTLFVSLCDANGTQSSPRMLPGDLDWRLGAFVAAMQAIARQQLAPIESPAKGCTPAIAVEAAHGEDVRQRCHAAAT